MQSDLKPVERLAAMGFRACGRWQDVNDKLKCVIAVAADSAAKNVLYAFIRGEEVLYIGKTTQSLKARMSGYQNPHTSQTTNVKGRKLILEALAAGDEIAVHVLPDNGLLHYGGFHVNLAAGLEDSIVRELKPKWNRLGL